MISKPVPEQIQPSLSVGECLRLRREQLGWSLPDVSSWLRIKLDYLQALEDGRPQDLPGSTYAMGFLRSYASSLGLDLQDVSRRFRQETAGLDKRQTLRFPAPAPERGVPAGAALLIGVVLMGAAYTGWYVFGGHESIPVQSIPPVPATLAPYAAERLAPYVAPTSPPVAAMPPSAAAPPSAVQPAAPSPIPGHQDATAAPGPPGEAAPPAASVPVVLKASAASWVQVRQAGGPVIYEHILLPGESWPVPPQSGALLMSIGNAAGITLSAGDLTTPALGPPGAVRRNLPLSADAIRDGSLLASSIAQRPPQQPLIQQPPSQQAGQNPPFLAGSGHGATLPASNGGQSDPEH